ncbi:MAG: hypothetical protein NT062_38785 [Proteobacteria bacterium]|nr:hypothetical protein [Pseudomonadota bacterium]
MRFLPSVCVSLSLLVAVDAGHVAVADGPPKTGITAGDDWEAPLVEATHVLKFGGEEWEFRLSFKNRGKAKTKGTARKVKLTVTAGAITAFDQTVTLQPGAIEPGRSFVHTFKVKAPAKGDAKVVKIVCDPGDGATTKEFPIQK